jgi:hypothetical protein
LRTLAAGGAAPDIFTLYLGQTVGGLADQLAHAELSDPVPRADRIAAAALIAVFEGVSALLFYEVNYFLEGGDSFHVFLDPLLAPEGLLALL